jgi:hypothetical protein
MNPQVDSMWYAFGDCVVCRDCYVTAVSGTSPAENLVLEHRIDPNICRLYSPLMQRKWAEARESGSFDEFLAYCRRRLRTYAQTILVAEKIKRLKLVRMKRARIPRFAQRRVSGVGTACPGGGS